MLELLHIENIAVIEEADIRFLPGFNALTGETGAGKSIVIDAMGAVLGGRTSRELIRTGADKAFVSAEFSAVPADLPGLSAAGVTPDEEGALLLQREISADGKNACRANGRPITVSQLRQIGADLLNIHGQHDGAALLDEEQHQTYLDRFGRTEEVMAAYRETYDALAELLGRIRALKMDEAEKARRMDSLRFQIGELERAELVPGEEEELLARRTLLRSGEKYIAALDGADYSLSGGEDSTTNNRMELTAVIEALRCLNQPCAVDLWSDSKYVIDGLEKGWAKSWQRRGWVKSDKKPALNPDLWEELLRLTALHTLRYHWVKGHAENPYNNRCDEMAVSEWKKRK